MDGRAWLDLVLDPGWNLRFEDILGGDPLEFPGYADALVTATKKSGESESVLVAEGTIDGRPAVVTSSVFEFMGGSMGWAHGERICQAFELATQRGIPLVACTASGGARMQEGMVALAQMPATLQARAAHAAAGLRMIAVLRSPTTGGVFASYANAADHLIALAGATIGFAGPRVAEAFTGEPLPAGSHTAAHALTNGLVDEVAATPDLARAALAATLHAGQPESRPMPTMRARWRRSAHHVNAAALPDEDAWRAVQTARDPERRATVRASLATIGASAATGETTIGGRPVMLIDLGDDRVPGVAAYRQAQRAMRDAEARNLPLVVLIDLAGANPSAASEASGIARTISETMSLAATASVRTIALVTGEGGSGGALALCAGADVLGICEGAMFSVIAPEGAAAILRRADVDGVARDLRCGPQTLRALGFADAVVPDDRAAEWVVEQLRADS